VGRSWGENRGNKTGGGESRSSEGGILEFAELHQQPCGRGADGEEEEGEDGGTAKEKNSTGKAERRGGYCSWEQTRVSGERGQHRWSFGWGIEAAQEWQRKARLV